MLGISVAWTIGQCLAHKRGSSARSLQVIKGTTSQDRNAYVLDISAAVGDDPDMVVVLKSVSGRGQELSLREIRVGTAKFLDSDVSMTDL